MKNVSFTILLLIILFIPIRVFALIYPDTNSKVVLVYDRTDDKILFDNNSNKIASIASLTKIVTTIVSINKINNFDENVTITREIINSVDPVASKAGLKVGDVVTYRDLLYASILPSGADATNALAISLSGSIDNFVAEMNKFVDQLELKNTHFVNVTGLDVDGHYSSAMDICKILNYSLDNELFKQVYTAKKYTLSNGLVVYSTLYKYNGSDDNNILGSKTGFTGDAGYCISTLSNSDGHEIITILLNAEHKDGYYYNIVDAKNIIKFVNDNYGNKLLLKKNSVIKKIPVILSKINSFDIVSNNDIYKFLPNDFDESNFSCKYDGLEKISYKNKKGEKIGVLNYFYDNELIFSEDVILNVDISFSFIEFFKMYYYYFLIILFVIFSVILFVIRRKKVNG